MSNKKAIWIGLGILVLVALGSFAAASFLQKPETVSVEVTRLVPQTVVVTEVVEVVYTVTPIPATATPTQTPPPTATPTPEALAVKSDGVTAWCMPHGSKYSQEELIQTGSIPAAGRSGARAEDGIMELVIEVDSCTVELAFNQPLPAGYTLEVYDMNPAPFLKIPLTTVTDHPEMAFAAFDHPYIVNPPFWEIKYRFQVVDSSSQPVWSEIMRFKRGSVVGYCWDGSLPDPVSYRCHIPGEAHPWDPWYGWDFPKEVQKP